MKLVDKLLNENIEEILTYKVGTTFTLNEVIRKSFKAGYQAAIDQLKEFEYQLIDASNMIDHLKGEVEDDNN